MTIEVPSNQELQHGIEAAKQVPRQVAHQTQQVSSEGRQVAKDVEVLLQHTQEALTDKNRDEQLQQALEHARRVSNLLASAKGQAIVGRVRGVPRGVRWERLVHFGRLLVTEAEFRSLLAECLQIGRDLVERMPDTLIGSEKTESVESAEGKEAAEKKKTIEEKRMAEGKENVEEKENVPDVTEQRGEARLWVRLTDEEQERLLDRIFSLLGRLGEREEYREGLQWILEQLQWLHSADWRENLDPDERTWWGQVEAEGEACWSQIRSLLEAWSGGISLEPWQATWRELGNRLQADQTMQKTMTELVNWLERAMQDPHWIKAPERRAELRERCVELGRGLNDRYQVLVRRIVDEGAYWLDALRRDATVQRLTDDLDQLLRDLFLDAQGRVTFKANLLSDLQTVLPAILRQLRKIRIPDVHSDDGSIRLDAEGIEVAVGEMAPKQLHLEFLAELEPKLRVGLDTTEASYGQTQAIRVTEYGEGAVGHVRFEPPETPKVENLATSESIQVHSVILFEVLRIHAECKNIRFRLEKRTFPSLLDHGLADLHIFDRGMSLHFLLHPDPTGSGSGLRVHRVHCHIHDMGLRLHSTQHDWLYTVMGPYVRRIAKERIERAIEDLFPLGPITMPTSEIL